jgi:hypothetical protein
MSCDGADLVFGVLVLAKVGERDAGSVQHGDAGLIECTRPEWPRPSCEVPVAPDSSGERRRVRAGERAGQEDQRGKRTGDAEQFHLTRHLPTEKGSRPLSDASSCEDVVRDACGSPTRLPPG